MENTGILVASGLIAGEALIGLLIATMNFFDIRTPEIFAAPSYLAGLAVLGLMALVMIRMPLGNAGRPEDPAPPTGMM